jgi:nucleoside-diphosphate-sugar epimerase
MKFNAPNNEQELDEVLTRPTPETIEAVKCLGGDLLILGSGGKMGPSLALLAQRSVIRAGLPYTVRCVSRFSDSSVASRLKSAGVNAIASDLLQPHALAELPDAANVIFMAGMKFGTTGAETQTWAINVLLPGLVARRYASSRIVVLSSGNVYPLVPVTSGGADERTPVAPVGEYAQTCVGRERMFQHGSLEYQTPVTILRLNYANDLRYGVLCDIANQVYTDQPIDLSMGNVNVIWQGDANRVILQAFSISATPAQILNLTGPETASVRWLAEQFGRLFGRQPIFTGEESNLALLSNAAECHRLFGYPRVTLSQMIEWTAHWIKIGGRQLAKPTHFERQDGRF